MQIIGDVITDGVFELCERNRASRTPQVFHLGPGKILVFSPDGVRHVDVINVYGQVHGVKKRMCHIVPGTVFSGPHVEEPGDRWVFHQPVHDVGAVFYIDEVASLAAVPVVRVIRFEKPQRSFFTDLEKTFVDQAAHVSLVIFVGAEDIEKLQTRQVIDGAGSHCPTVEEMLGVSVHVEWLEADQSVEGV